MPTLSRLRNFVGGRDSDGIPALLDVPGLIPANEEFTEARDQLRDTASRIKGLYRR